MSERADASGSGRPVPTLTEVLTPSQFDRADAIQIVQETIVPLQPSTSGGTGLVLDLDLDNLEQLGPPVMLPDGSLGVASMVPGSASGAGAQITERVLTEVQRRVDLMLEYRLRETLTPALARMTDSFIRDTRNELAATLRDIVQRAVEAELARERGQR